MNVQTRAGFTGAETALCCKLCHGPAYTRYRLDDGDGPFDLYECSSCGFHFIEHLDSDDLKVTAPVRDLAHNQERIDRNVGLLRGAMPSGRLLDIGCGAGDFLAALSGYETHGVEPDERYRNLASAKGLSVTACKPDHIFDAVTLWDVIEHVNDPRAITSVAAASLKPGGAILLDTPNRQGLFYRIGELTARLSGGRFPTLLNMQYSPSPFCHKQIFRETDLRALLTEAGFERVIVRKRFELSFPTSYYTQRFIKPAWLRSILDPLIAGVLNFLPINNKLIVVAFKR